MQSLMFLTYFFQTLSKKNFRPPPLGTGRVNRDLEKVSISRRCPLRTVLLPIKLLAKINTFMEKCPPERGARYREVSCFVYFVEKREQANTEYFQSSKFG